MTGWPDYAPPSMSVEYLNTHSRARYDSLEQFLGPRCDGNGFCWRFEDDPDVTWRLHWNQTRLKRVAT